MLKVLITGITGFLGSHIAETFVNNKIKVIGLKRDNSDSWRCRDFEDKIEWINYTDLDKWKNQDNTAFSIIIIHCAWKGVESIDRNDWFVQSENIQKLIQLLDLSNYIKVDKFIFLGSQAEYGFIDGRVKEDYIPAPSTAYGGIKLACLEILKTYATQNNINWLWLRVFSVFGEKESNNWLIPSLVKSMRESKEMNFTSGEQNYAYLYVNDFSKMVFSLLMSKASPGIYNISSSHVQNLRFLIETIRDKINPDFGLNFGAISQRKDQSMHVEGDISKILSEIGPFQFTDFNVALSNVIKYYLSNI